MFACAIPGFFGNGITINSSLSASLVNTSSSVKAIRSASITFNTDGTLSYSPLPGSSGSSAWLTQTGTAYGNSWWIRLTAVGAVNSTYSGTGMIPGVTWYQINSTRTFTVSNTGTANEGMGSLTLDFSKDSGTTIFKTLTTAVTWDVGYTGA